MVHNSGMQGKMAFERLMRNHYEHWDNRDMKAYSKTIAHDVEFTQDYGTGGVVKHNGRESVTNMVAKFREAVDTDEFDEFRHELKSFEFSDVKADRIQADVAMYCWQRVKATQEWKQQFLEVWPTKKLRSGRFNLNVVAELRNGEWLITKQDFNSESSSKSNAQMQAEMAFQKLMCNHYEAWDNRDALAYSKTLAHDVEFTQDYGTGGVVKHNGKASVTNMVKKFRQAVDTDEFDEFRHELKSYKFVNVSADSVQGEVAIVCWQREKATKEWKQQFQEVWPTKKVRSGRFRVNAVAELRNGEWLITKQDYSSQE